jgi:hypothetical protein
MAHRPAATRQNIRIGDYQDNTKVDRHLATEILESADQFVRAIEEKLSKST